MRLLQQWSFTAWWVAAVLAWVASAPVAAAGGPARQLEWLAPLWGAPWALPLAAIRALGPDAGVPFAFELALLIGLGLCLLLDLRRRGRRLLARADWSVAAEG